MALRVKMVLYASLCVLASSAFGLNPEEIHQQLKHVDRDFSVVGTICEEVARLEYQEIYPEGRFTVLTGIPYKDPAGVILGELDLVVFRNSDRRVVLVGEVKCSINPGAALRKAHQQLGRFSSYIRNDAPIIIYMENPFRIFAREQFSGDIEFTTISQKGSEAFGFDRSIDFDLETLAMIRKKLVDCHRSGICS